jgi:hypothetical protein
MLDCIMWVAVFLGYHVKVVYIMRAAVGGCVPMIHTKVVYIVLWGWLYTWDTVSRMYILWGVAVELGSHHVIL